MALLDAGRICMKIAGREAGSYCVVLKNVNKSFVLVTGPKILTGVKRRNANISHLEATPYKIDVTENLSDQDVVSAMEKANLIKKLNLHMPSAAELKAREEKKEEKAAKVEEKAAEKKEEKPKKKEAKAKEKK